MARSLKVKTLKGESFQIEVAPEAVMNDVKAKIAEQRGVDPASQVLICGGKTLKDDDALSSSVAAGGFLVLMVKELVIDPASVERLTAMGFPEDQARAALRAAFNDVSRAASYLMEGIPEGVAEAGVAAGAADTSIVLALVSFLPYVPFFFCLGCLIRAGGRAGDGDEEGEEDVSVRLGVEGGGNPLNFMRFHPQFDQLRGLVRDNPAMLPQVLQQLGAQSPELMERINENQGDFLRLMNEPPDVEGQAMMDMGIEGLIDGMEQEDDEEADAAAAGFAAGGGEGEQGQGQQVTVELTEEEDAAVQNLMAMVPGVGRDQVIEAFIACDKNAEMAANLLFENAF
eukprot:jgi/Undpi1/4847/HiC_scaffold_19.g08200.m1